MKSLLLAFLSAVCLLAQNLQLNNPPPSYAPLRDFVSVKDYGAVPNDGSSSTVNTANTSGINSAITSALANGSALYIPGATSCYWVNGTITVSGAITIYGDGTNSCIKLAASANVNVFTLTGSGGITLRDFLIDGNGANQGAATYNAINQAAALSGLKLVRMTLQNASNGGAVLGSTSNLLVDSCTFAGNGSYQFDYLVNSSTNPSNLVIVNSTFDDTNATAAFVDLYINGYSGTSASLQHVLIQHNIFRYHGLGGSTETDAVAVSSNSGAQISDVKIDQNSITFTTGTTTAGYAIESAGVIGATISANNIVSGPTGIWVVKSIADGVTKGQGTITGNYLTNALSGSTGIRIASGAGPTTVNDNLLGGAFSFGIALNESNTNVTGNTVLMTSASFNGIQYSCSACTGVLIANNNIIGYPSSISGIFPINIVGNAGELNMIGNHISNSYYGIVFGSLGSTYTNVLASGNQFTAATQPYYPGTGLPGVIVNDAPNSTCRTYTLSNNGTNFLVNSTTGIAIPASTAASVVLFPLPAKGMLQSLRIKSTTAWTGTGFTSATISIGDSVGGTTYYTSTTYDMHAATGNTNFQEAASGFTAAGTTVPLLHTADTYAGSNVIAALTANQNWNANPLTGVTDITACWITLP